MTDAVCVIAHRRDPDRPRRAFDGLFICGGHRTGLARSLLELPDMHRRLVERHVARAGSQSEVRTGGHAGLSLHDAVSRLRGDIASELGTWARDLAEERAFSLPEDNLRDVCRFLIGANARNLDWRCAHPSVDEFHDTVDRLHRQAFALLYPRGRRRFEVADCIEVTSCDVNTRSEQRCPGRMLATLTGADDEMPSALFCSDCGFEVVGNQWINYGNRHRKAMGVSA